MTKNILFGSILAILSLIAISCKVSYSFTGGSVGDAKTIQIDFFNNNAQLVEPTLSQEFTINLQDFFLSQTNLDLVKTDGDLQFEGEITRYTITPMTATAQQTAAQNRLTIEINVRYYNKTDETKNFEQRFSHFYDYPADIILEGDKLEPAYEEIFERINQNIFNASVGGW
ncbi:LptE family protein [Wenyingzhuangia sp. IMCC45574]